MGTSSLDPRRNFLRVASRPSNQINLALSALYIASEEDDSVDVVEYMGKLSAIAEKLRPKVSNRLSMYDRIYMVNDLLFGEMRFAGNSGSYYEIENSYLHRVLDRRLGIPITLSIIYMEVSRRVGLETRGVNMAGHFLVSAGQGSSLIFVDPFRKGRLYSRWECLRLIRGDEDSVSHDSNALDRLERNYLPIANNSMILARLLNNMKIIYTERQDLDRAVAAAERIQVLMPRNWRNIGDIAQLHGKSGRVRDAYESLSHMVRLMPAGIDHSIQMDALELLRPLAESNEDVDPEKIHEIPFFRI